MTEPARATGRDLFSSHFKVRRSSEQPVHLSWRLRLRPAPFGIGPGWHVIEQHAYADVGKVIESLGHPAAPAINSLPDLRIGWKAMSAPATKTAAAR
jgi:hypothetical protein